jgi:hypothetical protein
MATPARNVKRGPRHAIAIPTTGVVFTEVYIGATVKELLY